MGLIAVNDVTFADHVKRQGLTLVDFGAAWCPPCKTLKPILDQLGSEQADRLAVLEVDCDESPELASAYGVMSMPTVIVFHRGEPADKFVGLRPKSVYQTALARYRSGETDAG